MISEFNVTVSQKAAFSLLISVVLFTILTVVAYTGLFDWLETRFFNPSVTKSLTRKTARDAELIQELLADLQKRFAASLEEPAVRRSFLPDRSEEDLAERARIYRALHESLGGLQSVRMVDSDGRRIHFSTYAPDIFQQDGVFAVYRNYGQEPRSLPFDEARVSERETVRLILGDDRIIFSFPFRDSSDVYCGSALFTVSVKAVTERLISRGRLNAGEDVLAVNAPPGFITGGPAPLSSGLIAAVSAMWDSGLFNLTPIDSSGGIRRLLISAKTSQGVFYGHIFNEGLFSFSPPVKALLLLSAFFSTFLTLFFCLNIRQDPILIIQNRLKALQVSLIEQFFERKVEMDWSRWIMELEQRREGVRAEVKRGVKFDLSRYVQADIDSLIDKSWDELLAFISAQQKNNSALDEQKLQNLLARVLRTMPWPEPSSASRLSASRSSVKLPSAKLPSARLPPEPARKDSVMRKDISETKETEKSEPKPRLGGLLAAAAKKRAVIDSEHEVKAVKDLEETEEIEELEVLEEIEEDTAGSLSPAGPLAPAGSLSPTGFLPPAGRPSALDIKELESSIEFSDTGSGAEETGEPLNSELEIVSPFSSILSPLESGAVLQEQDGVPHINSSVLSPDPKTESKLDQGFKGLVDEVIKR